MVMTGGGERLTEEMASIIEHQIAGRTGSARELDLAAIL
jgi:hypothetical protein